MPASKSSTELKQEFEEAIDQMESDDEIERISGSFQSEGRVGLDGDNFNRVIDLGISLGESIFYTSAQHNDGGSIAWAQIGFLYRDYLHVLYIESAELSEAKADELGEQLDEGERKRELANELLEEYSDLLSKAQEYRLNHHVQDMRTDRLFELQDWLEDQKERKEREERIDNELEQRLAEKLYQEDRFSRQFNELDTEMLLKKMDIEFDEEAVRIEEMHKRAKSLLKIGE